MNIRSTFESLKGTELQQESFHENLEWDDFVAEMQKLSSDDPALKKLILRKKTEDMIDGLTFDDILTSNFTNAKEAIDQMTISKRIDMLEELHTYRDALYESVGNYGAEGIPRDEQLSPNDFRVLIGRIKHVEILMNMLYGIV